MIKSGASGIARPENAVEMRPVNLFLQRVVDRKPELDKVMHRHDGAVAREHRVGGFGCNVEVVRGPVEYHALDLNVRRREHLLEENTRRYAKVGPAFRNAMTSSEERTSAEAEGYRIERPLMDCVAPPF